MTVRKDYEQLFSHINHPELPSGLYERIVSRIAREKRMLGLKQRITIFSAGFAGSMAAFVPAFQAAHQGLSESGFMQFLSLAFTDFGVVAAHWQSFCLMLLEALPVASLIAVSAAAVALLASLRYLVSDLQKVRVLNN